MAADTLADRGGVRSVAKKIYRVNDTIVGASGIYMDTLLFVHWCEGGMDMEKVPEFRQYGRNGDAPDFVALVLSPAGLVLWTEHFQPRPVLEEFFAIGSGTAPAMAAMYMEASAEKAVEIAMLVDVGTGGDVEVETF